MIGQREFDCPSCGAALHTTGYETQVTCEYCGNSVLVPPEMRIAPPPPYNPPPAYQPAPPVYAPPIPVRPDSLANTAMWCGILGLILGICVAGWPFALLLCIAALALVWQYNTRLRNQPGLPVHPADEGRIRIARITGSIGLVLLVLICLGVALFVAIAPAVDPSLLTPVVSPVP